MKSVYQLENSLTNDQFVIRRSNIHESHLLQLRLTDLLGHSQWEDSLQPQIPSIKYNTRDLPSGIYFLHVQQGNSLRIHKIVKN